MDFKIKQVEGVTYRKVEKVFTLDAGAHTVTYENWDVEPVTFWPEKLRVVYEGYDGEPWAATLVELVGTRQGKRGQRLQRVVARDFGSYQADASNVADRLARNEAPDWVINIVRAAWPLI
jgi:hypothetical protein